jgi:hypothetical protein
MYERTEEGFAAAYRSAQFMARLHRKPISVYVSARQPDRYVVSGVGVLDDIADGTKVLSVEPAAPASTPTTGGTDG